MECRPMAQMGSRTICETHDRPEIECVREDLSNANLQIGAWQEYTELLSAELESLAGLAHAHGWRSSRHEKGVELRKKLGIPGSSEPVIYECPKHGPLKVIKDELDHFKAICTECSWTREHVKMAH